MFKLPRDHLSVSQIRMYLRCPAQYYFRYIQEIKVPPTGSLVLGRAVHSGLEHYYRQKLHDGQPAPVREVLDVFAAAFDNESNDALWDEDPNKVKEAGVKLIKLYCQDIAPVTIPAAVEMKIEIPIDGTVLLGYIDLVTTDGQIIDHKVVSRTPPSTKVDEDIQLTAYAWAYKEIYGVLPDKVRFDFLVRNKSPKVLTMTAKRAVADFHRFTRLVQGVANAIWAGIYYPNPDNLMCSSTACGYWDECHRTF